MTKKLNIKKEERVRKKREKKKRTHTREFQEKKFSKIIMEWKGRFKYVRKSTIIKIDKLHEKKS